MDRALVGYSRTGVFERNVIFTDHESFEQSLRDHIAKLNQQKRSVSEKFERSRVVSRINFAQGILNYLLSGQLNEKNMIGLSLHAIGEAIHRRYYGLRMRQIVDSTQVFVNQLGEDAQGFQKTKLGISIGQQLAIIDDRIKTLESSNSNSIPNFIRSMKNAGLAHQVSES